MHRAQDWELNYRLRAQGHTIWFSPDLQVTYRPRSSLRALVKQMYETGKWRREVVRRYPDTANLRYLARPSPWSASPSGRSRARRLGDRPSAAQAGFAAPLGYAGVILGVRGHLALDVTLPGSLPLVLAATHLAWGRASSGCEAATLTLCPYKVDWHHRRLMPLVRIDVQQGRTPTQLRRLADIVQDVMLEVFAAPPGTAIR